MHKIFDVAVIGGGIIGSMIFDDLSLSGYSAVLIEKTLDVATGSTKANSGLIHAGFDAKPNTKKAIFNVKGNCDLRSLTSAKELVLPKEINGSLYLGSLTRAEGLILPEKINGYLYLSSLTSGEGLVLPEGLEYLDLP